MNIKEMTLKELKPYEKNPRKNDEAVKYVVESIKNFGFKVPIVVDKDNIIVAGHTRYKAAKQLKLKTVPCIIADDLNEEQIKAFRLADNKVSEIAEWDFDLLNEELEGIFNIEMDSFGFDFDLGFDEIPDDLEMERLEDDGEKESINYLKYDNKKIPLTEEETELLNQIYDTYIQENKTNYGFIKYILGE